VVQKSIRGTEPAVLLVIRFWRSLEELATFALKRHGFGNSDVGFGVTYPDDLDPDERMRDPIPDGCVCIYEGWGPPLGLELFVPEIEYLDTLAEELVSNGLSEAAADVRALRQRLIA
jgi:hypothetical protein